MHERDSLCLLIDMSGAAKEQVCVSGHTQDPMPTYMLLTQMDMHYSFGGVHLWECTFSRRMEDEQTSWFPALLEGF